MRRACAAILVLLVCAMPARGVEPARPYGLRQDGFVPLSSASCASSACHGNGHVGKRGGEHSTWSPDLGSSGATDPHARSYRVLFNAESAKIAHHLGIAAAHKERKCLNCHAVEGVQPEAAVVEGVGCAACHGPAEKWNAAHVQPEWKALTNREKWERHGFVPAKNLTARTLNCARCHVGDETRDVNHDMIAAGHPRLAFEYTRFHYHASYRKHWIEAIPQPDFEVRAWLIGQLTTLRAAIELLRVRADRAAADRAPWPEFSGYSCSSCHHPLGNETRRGIAESPRNPGVPGWELWNTAAFDVAAAHVPGGSTRSFPAMRELKALMGNAHPKPAIVREKAALAVAELDAFLVRVQDAEGRAERLPAGFPQRLLHALCDNALSPDGTRLRDTDFDFLASHALACGAMVHASGMPAWTAPVRGLNELLRLPLNRDNLERTRDRFRLLRDATTFPVMK